jgi:acyl-coenzyme A thioesterase PaaI-like protein
VTPLDLADLLRARPTGDPGRFTLDVPDGLQQGRGAWGGVATGAMVSAARQAVPRPELAVRTLSAQLIAPLRVGRADIAVEVLRQGAATTTAAVRVSDPEGSVVAHGVVVLGDARAGEDVPDGEQWLSLTPPAELAAGPDSVAVVPLGPPIAPVFLRQLELRPIAGLPFTGGSEPDVTGRVRPLAPVSVLDAAVVVAMADAWWVAIMPRLDRPRPVGTLGFTVDLTTAPEDLPVEPDGRLRPLFHRGRTLAARQGYTLEQRELWTEDGRLVSWNTQTVAVIK